MNIKEIIELTNCNCLSSIMEFDYNRHNKSTGNNTQQAIKTLLVFETLAIYRDKHIDSEGLITKNIKETAQHSIPFFHCPICGNKTKLSVEEDSYYYQFIKK